MTTWGIFWVCLFGASVLNRAVSCFARYRVVVHLTKRGWPTTEAVKVGEVVGGRRDGAKCAGGNPPL